MLNPTNYTFSAYSFIFLPEPSLQELPLPSQTCPYLLILMVLSFPIASRYQNKGTVFAELPNAMIPGTPQLQTDILPMKPDN